MVPDLNAFHNFKLTNSFSIGNALQFLETFAIEIMIIQKKNDKTLTHTIKTKSASVDKVGVINYLKK